MPITHDDVRLLTKRIIAKAPEFGTDLMPPYIDEVIKVMSENISVTDSAEDIENWSRLVNALSLGNGICRLGKADPHNFEEFAEEFELPNLGFILHLMTVCEDNATPEQIYLSEKDEIDYFLNIAIQKLSYYFIDNENTLPIDDEATRLSIAMMCNIVLVIAPYEAILYHSAKSTDFNYMGHLDEMLKIISQLPQNSDNEAQRTGNTMASTRKKSINFADYRETEDVGNNEQYGDFETAQGDVFVTGEDGIVEKNLSRLSSFNIRG